MDNAPNQKKSFFDLLQPKQAFILGCVSSILVLGTISCLVSGAYIWKTRSNSDSYVAANSANVANTVKANNAAAGSATNPAIADVTGKLTVTSSDYVTGDGQITVVIYSDFQCPYCKRFDATVQQAIKDYTGKVKWIFRNFPLSFHDEAQNAAEAAECAGEQGKFWEYATKLFQNQGSLGEELYKKLATDLTFNTADFDICRSSDKMLAAIQEDQTSAAALGVRGTPASFLISKDGSVKQIQGGAISYASLKALLDQELTK